MKRFVVALALCGLVFASPALAGQDLGPAAFFGTFSGGGIAENEDSLYFAVTARDFDVTIAPLGDGFRIKWTSVIRSGGDPARPRVKRKSMEKTFLAADQRRVYRCAGNADPLAGGDYCWARIAGNTLVVYALVITDGGRYEVQQYDRTLSGTGMKLVFTRTRDGERVRKVTGRLVKTGE
jgi:hypothetical protein